MTMTDALLTDTDQRILQWQREGRPDAEIAVRLGMTGGETKERIQKLKRRVDEEDAELSRWRRPQPGTEPVIGGAPMPATPAEPQPSGTPPEKTYSRRAVIGAGLAGLGASAAVAAGGFALFGRGGDDPASSDAEGTPTSRPGSTTTPGAEPTSHPGLAAITRDDSAWARTILPNRGEIPYESGVGFIDTSTGDIDVMKLVGTPDDRAFGGLYQVSPSGRYVAGDATSVGANATGLLDRESGQSWSWDPAALRLLYLSDEHFAFAELGGDPVHPFGTGPVHIVDTDFAPVASGDIGPDPAGAVQVAGPGADSDLFVIMYGQYRPFIFDLESGAMVEGETLPADQPVRGVATQSPPGVVSVISTRPEGETTTFVRSDYGPDGRAVRHVGLSDRAADVGWPTNNYSPDGRWSVRQDAVRDTSYALGDGEVWSYVELQDAESVRPRFRVLSGQLASGRPWLADSSAFIIESGRPDVEYANYNDFRTGRAYYLVDPERHELTMLNDVPEDLPFSPYFTGVTPAPDNPDLIAFGGMIVHNHRTGAWFGPSNGTLTFGDPWAGQSRELRFVFPPGGRDGAGSGTILPPYIEEPPFRKEVTLQIARAGTCVNLRSGPSKDADVLDCLADGARLTVVSPSEPLPREEEFGDFHNGRPAFWSSDGDAGYDPDTFQMYVHGRAPSGATGWVAIQYLDWAP
jgi:hypothetical protein